MKLRILPPDVRSENEPFRPNTRNLNWDSQLVGNVEKPWNASPPAWTHSRLGEIWIYNEGMRSCLRNAELRGGCAAGRYHFRRLRGGGQSARSSLNVIDWRHACWVRFTHTRFYALLFCENNDLVWEIISVTEKRMKNYCENYWQYFRIMTKVGYFL